MTPNLLRIHLQKKSLQSEVFCYWERYLNWTYNRQKYEKQVVL